MKTKNIIAALAFSAAMLTSCNSNSNNPLLEEWNTPFGVAPFDKIKVEHYKPAIIEALKQHTAEIDAIINNPAEPDFDNTIAALDASGDLFNRIYAVFGSETSINATPQVMEVEMELVPLVSKHFDEISMNEKLFERVRFVYENRESMNLDPAQMKLLTDTYKSYERSGATLPQQSKDELKEINSRISELEMLFEQHLLKETGEYALVIDDQKNLAGLSQAQIAAAAKRAEGMGLENRWAFGLDNPSVMPFLQYADNAALRKEIADAYLNRGNNNNEYDNKSIVIELVKLRDRKAEILGYKTYADYVLEERMAKTSDAVYGLLDQLWKPALRSASAELADMKPLASKDGITDFGYSDWRYYFEKVKAAKFDYSDEELRPYLSFENVRKGIFYVANKLYGITFTQIENIPVPNPEAIAFECREADGRHLGVIYMDMFARPGLKRGGAWCTGYREQHYSNGERVAPVVTIVGNFTRGTDDEPALLTPDETSTFFHEFGHALQGLLQDVKYNGNASITRDFVELPSQIMEHWAFEPQVLKEYATHWSTGEVIPAYLIEKLDRVGKYGQGFATVEYLAASLLDMDYHTMDKIPEDLDVEIFESKVLSDRKILSQIPPRYRSTYFRHVFAGGYTVGYYSYIWAEVLDADAYEAFKETGDIFNQDVAGRFRKNVLERGGEDDAMTLYVNFRGKKPGIEPLLKNRGLK